MQGLKFLSRRLKLWKRRTNEVRGKRACKIKTTAKKEMYFVSGFLQFDLKPYKVAED
jgi:hypothetical protein